VTDAWFQRATNSKWPMGNQMVTRPMTSRDPKGRDPSMLKSNIAKTAGGAI